MSVKNPDRERGGTGFGGVRLGKCIVTLQVAFSLILLIDAALFGRTLGKPAWNRNDFFGEHYGEKKYWYHTLRTRFWASCEFGWRSAITPG